MKRMRAPANTSKDASERVWKMGSAGDWPATRPPTGLAERGHEGSRGLSAFAARQSAASARRRQSTEGWVLWLCVAERRLKGAGPFHRSTVAPRRRIGCLAAVRGLKPTATIVVSLRETDRKCPRPADQNGGEPRCKRPCSLLDLEPALVPSGESRDGTQAGGRRVACATRTNAGFNLQSAPAVTGTFTNISGATSPYTNLLTSPQLFFRLKAE